MKATAVAPRGTLSFLGSAMARKWMDSGRMVATVIAGRESDGSLLLEHERIDYPTYPWEWTPGQWMAAADLTLDLCEESLAAGLILKDATPLNVLFRNAEPVFVDVLSFDARKPGNTHLARLRPVCPHVSAASRGKPLSRLASGRLHRAVGWQNEESLSLLQRSGDAFDCVLMLGVIHHMLLIDQIPLAAIFDLVRRLTTRWAIIEWVPATDSQFQQLCRGRQDIYGHLDESAFLAAAGEHLERRLVENLPNGRSLWLFQTK